MAGVTDRPFRQLCKRLGVRGFAVSEIGRVGSATLRATPKSQRAYRSSTARSNLSSCRSPARIPTQMADAARYNVDRGAQIIDINMGCPAKKVCNVAAGSALLQNEPLVAAILTAVVAVCRSR